MTILIIIILVFVLFLIVSGIRNNKNFERNYPLITDIKQRIKEKEENDEQRQE